MVYNRSKNNFGNQVYKHIVLKGVHTIYDGCVTAIDNNYLKQANLVTELSSSDDSYEEGQHILFPL